MPKFSFVLLYVDNPTASADFYAALLECPVVEASPTFAMLPLTDGVMLGLWSRHTVEPASAASPGAGEIALVAETLEGVDETHVLWSTRGVRIAQTPRDLDFGRAFVALDPDGHRIRVMFPVEA